MFLGPLLQYRSKLINITRIRAPAGAWNPRSQRFGKSLVKLMFCWNPSFKAITDCERFAQSPSKQDRGAFTKLVPDFRQLVFLKLSSVVSCDLEIHRPVSESEVVRGGRSCHVHDAELFVSLVVVACFSPCRFCDLIFFKVRIAACRYSRFFMTTNWIR